MVLMRNDVPDRMKPRVWKMIADWKGLYFILVLSDNQESEKWLLPKVMFTKLFFLSNSPHDAMLIYDLQIV